MTTLTKNRILEAGDEYRFNGEWKPVPEKDIGLQIMFTTYAEVRRPTEQPPPKKPYEGDPPWENKPTKQGSQMARQESAKLPIEGSIPSPASQHMAEYLPTVISKKAHTNLPKIEGRTVGVEGAEVGTTLSVGWPDEHLIWIGRNGTFIQRGLHLQLCKLCNDCIAIKPVGKRGIAKNAVIQFPSAMIPKIVDWLNKHKPTTK